MAIHCECCKMLPEAGLRPARWRNPLSINAAVCFVSLVACNDAASERRVVHSATSLELGAKVNWPSQVNAASDGALPRCPSRIGVTWNWAWIEAGSVRVVGSAVDVGIGLPSEPTEVLKMEGQVVGAARTS